MNVSPEICMILVLEQIFLWPDDLANANPLSCLLQHAGIQGMNSELQPLGIICQIASQNEISFTSINFKSLTNLGSTDGE